jgi:hypothetical protein
MWTEKTGWKNQITCNGYAARANLVLVFGSPALMKQSARMAELKKLYPLAYICGCSTAGEIAGDQVTDDTLTATSITFDGSHIAASKATIDDPAKSFDVGATLAAGLPTEDLAHIFVLSDGLAVNGSELVRGLASKAPAGVAITGGLSGDGARFAETYVCADGVVLPRQILALGFYGKKLKIGYGSMGGWDSFGLERRITRSEGNVLYELDGRSALELYKEYLGPHAAQLPASGLLFPLTVRANGSSETVVRTILAVDEAAQSMTFAGDIPQGGMAQLMSANFDRLVDGADGAAKACCRKIGDGRAELAVLISCVGRKLVLQQRIDEEVEAVVGVLGNRAVTTGFYSYGEISPFTPNAQCALHNQTMTITTFAEA